MAHLQNIAVQIYRQGESLENQHFACKVSNLRSPPALPPVLTRVSQSCYQFIDFSKKFNHELLAHVIF